MTNGVPIVYFYFNPMKPFPSDCDRLLSELTAEIKTAHPERASEIIERVVCLLILAGYGEAAHESLLYLLNDTLCLNPGNSAVNYYIYSIVRLCNALSIALPDLPEHHTISPEQLSILLRKQEPKSLLAKVLEKLMGIHLSSKIEAWLRAAAEARTKKQIVKCWRQSRDIGIGQLIAYRPTTIIPALLSGVLNKDMGISSELVTAFIHELRNYSYVPQLPFIPATLDWIELIEKYDRQIALKIAGSHNYYRYYVEDLTKQHSHELPPMEAEVQSLEARLGKRLPPSYRSFLLSRNGWTRMDSWYRISKVQDIDWFHTLNPEFVDCWCENYEDEEVSDREYFYYGHLQAGVIRSHYVKTALQITDFEDGMAYLLNPMVVDAVGEWEAWNFDAENGSAYRYRSFWDMMQKIYRDDWS
jgi:hypothetical protein